MIFGAILFLTMTASSFRSIFSYLFFSDVCRDKLDSCDKLADSGVCETSKDAMIVNCPETCNFCGKYYFLFFLS